jgi:pathogenesis-related protein 1
MSVKTLRRLTILSTTVFLLAASASADRLFFQDGTKVDGTYLGGSGGSIQFRMNDGTVKSYDLSSIQWIYLSQKPTQAGTSNPSTSQPQSPAGPHPSPSGTNATSAVVPSNTGSDVPQDQAQLALDFHNQKRRDVGSPPLQWSAELAAYAQKWANHLANDNHCQLDHTVDNKYGENLFGGSGTTYTALFASQDWYSEKQKYTYGILTDANWYATGHYTQMVWKNTTQVGIGQANCAGGGSVIAAEYYPPGNYMGEKPY